MHFDGAPADHQAKLSNTTKGRPKIEAGKTRTVPVSPASKLAGRKSGHADDGDSSSRSPPFRMFECRVGLHQRRWWWQGYRLHPARMGQHQL